MAEATATLSPREAREVTGAPVRPQEQRVGGPPRHGPPRHGRGAPRAAVSGTTALLAGALGLLALVLRLAEIDTAYNIFIDEATYAEIARSVGMGDGVRLHGEPFVLHPPLGLLALGGVAGLSGVESLAPLVMVLRPVVAVAGALVVVVVVGMLRSAGLTATAVAAGLLLALDPFAISFDSRVMLEAFAQLAAVTTVACAVLGARTPPASSRWWTGLAAVAGAATFATKETFGLVVVLTLALAAMVSAGRARRGLAGAVVGSVLGYAGVSLVVVMQVGLGTWWASRTTGLARLVGTYQPTGFSSPDSQVSIWDRVLPNAMQYGVTYGVLVLGGLSGAVLLVQALRRDRRHRRLDLPRRAAELLAGAWTVAACGYVAYAVLFGSLEEQMFYIALAPCVVSLVLLVDLMCVGRRPRTVAAALLAVALTAQAVVWVQVRATPDDVYPQLLTWLATGVPEGSRIAVTEETAQFLVEDHDLGEWASMEEIVAQRVDYVLVSPSLVAQGYGRATPELTDALAEQGEPVLVLDGRRGDLVLYDVRGATGGSR